MFISLIFFNYANRNLIDRELFEIIKQDATYYNKETMKDNKIEKDIKELNTIERQKISDESIGIVRIKGNVQ